MTNSLSRLIILLFRAFTVLVLCMVLLFPAYKAIWLGYVPVAIGFGVAWVILKGLRKEVSILPPFSTASFVSIVVFSFVLIQAVLLVVMRPAPLLDGLFVYREAVALFEQGRFSPATYYGPGQIIWYFAFFKLLGTSPLIAQVSHLVPAVLLIVVVYFFGRRAGGEQTGRWSSLLLAAYPSYLLYVLVTPYYFYLYTLILTVLALAWFRAAEDPSDSPGSTCREPVERCSCAVWRQVRSFLRSRQKLCSNLLQKQSPPSHIKRPGGPFYKNPQQRLATAIVAGLAGGLGALVKPVLLIAPLQALIYFLFQSRSGRWRRVLLWWCVFVIGFAVTLLPWVVRNARVFGEPVLVCTSGGFVLHSANNPESNGLYSPIPDQVEVDTPQEMLAESRRQSGLAKAFIKEHPLTFLRLAANKFVHTWGNETTYAELVNIRGRRPAWLDPSVSFVAQTGWACLVLLWAFAAWRGKNGGSSLELLIAIIVLSHAFVYSVYEGGARHHLPMVPLIIIYVIQRMSANFGSVLASTSSAQAGQAECAENSEESLTQSRQGAKKDAKKR